MVVSAVGQAREVPGFADRMGTRLVVPQPSGALLEFLHFNDNLSSTAFFEPAVKGRLKRLSSFRHAAYARASRVQRDPAHGNRLVLVSAYPPGRRLADIMVLARRARLRATLPATLSLARQLMTGLALLHDYAPDVFHGAIGPERLVVGPDGRVVITEYVLGAAVEQAAAEWGRARLWRDLRVAALDDVGMPRYGRRLDLVQVGMVTLSLLVDRPLTAADYPDALPELLAAARETSADGDSQPLGASLSEWLTRMLRAEADTGFRTLVEAQKAFARMVDEEPRYRVSSLAVEAFFQQCEEAALLPVAATELEPAEITTAAPAFEPDAEQVSSPAVEPAVDPVAGGAQPAPADAAPIPPLPSPLPAAEPDAFAPWPVVVGSDTATTLFETYSPQVAPREVPGLSAPDGRAAESSSAPPPAQPVTAAEPASDLSSDWLDNTAARSLRESLDALPPQPGEGRVSELFAGGSQPGDALPDVVPVAPAYEWASTPQPGLEPRVEVAPFEPLPPPLEAIRFEPLPHSTRADVEPTELAATAEPAGIAPAQPGSGAARATERRASAVLSYDEVHKPVKPSRGKGLAIAASVILVLAAGGFAGFRLLSRPAPEKPAAPADAPRAAAAALGGFQITTQPSGARVSVDGKFLGTAPVRIDGLQPGLHSLTVESEWGIVEEPVTVEAGKVVPLSIATVGWIKVAAPVSLRVSEQGKFFGTTGEGRVMVPAGRHHFELVSQEVAVRLRQFVDVPPGATVTVPVELPQGTLNLTSDQPAQVLLDGQVIGDTPMMSVPASLGPHEVIFRSEKYGDVSYTVNVTLAAPVRVSVAFSKR